ncbi:hypothetical protein [Olleya sp. AS48]|uniref:hypothetical protein n=1 Tax=Olleya sp. AS48 TaxID=3135774 RepID=UPI003179B1EC
MKLLSKYIFLLMPFLTFSQNSELNLSLEESFKDYSSAILNEDIESELELMYPTLFENSSIEKIKSEYEKDNLKKDTTQITKTKNILVIIKTISEPIKKRSNEYRVIDYIVVKNITFGKEYHEDLKREASASENEKKNWICNNHSRRDYPVQSLSFNEQTRIGTYSYHKKILAIRNLSSKKWHFISDKWWSFQSLSKHKNNTGWIIPRNYKKRNISNIQCFIPRKIMKKMERKTGYNNVYN